MTDDEGGAAASGEDTRDYEPEAREMGWVPEAEFRGNKKPERFKTAQEFVEDIPPYVRKMLDKAETKFNDRVSRLEKTNAKTVERLTAIHNQELAELRSKKREAVKAGNVELVDKLDDEIEKRRDGAPLTDDPKAKKAEAEKAFGDANPWYGSNKKMTAFARGLSQDLAAAAEEAGKPLSYDDNIKQVLAEVRAEFPEYFDKSKPAANGHAAVDGGSENGSAPSRSDPLAKLPNEARAQAKADMKKFPKVYPDAQSWIDVYQAK